MNFFNKIITSLLILASVSIGTINLISKNPILAQAAETIGQETTITNINEIESDSLTKFGQRLTNQFKRENLKTEPCGNTITDGIFDSNLGSSVIKSVKVSCNNWRQSWLKLVWDNGLIGWVQNPAEKVTTVSLKANPKTNFFNNFGVEASANSVTCKDYQYQVHGLNILNQYPNLDIDDDGIGCEQLPKNPNEVLLTGNEQLLREQTNQLDKNNDGKIACTDFETQVLNIEILAIFPRLDADKDGVGCEANPEGDATFANFESFVEESDLNLPDIELSEANLQNNIDWSVVSLSLQQALNKDIAFLTNSNATCANFDLGCKATNSLAGLGNQGMWLFKFITGILQGAGQSIVDLLGQIWALVSNPGETINNIINSLKEIVNNPKLLLQLFQDELDTILGLDTLERANRIGRIIGGLIPEIIAGVVTAGAGTVGLKALQSVRISQKVANTIIKIGKLVGKTVRILSGNFDLPLTKIKSGAIGITSKTATKLVKTLDDTGFDGLIKVTAKESDKILLPKIRLLLKGAKLIDSKLVRFSQKSINKTFRNGDKVDDLIIKIQNNTINPADLPPITTVKMPDGNLTGIDNRRLVATNKANTKANIVEYNYNDSLPIDQLDRFVNDRTGKFAKTWGEAVSYRLENQGSTWFKQNPYGSSNIPKY